jgi:hypothetical protein
VTHNGVTLIESTKNPEFDSARALLARGIVGQVEVWRHGASFPSMRLDIEKAARLTAKEGDRDGLRFARWHPHPEEVGENAVSCRPVESRTAGDKAPATYPPEKKSAVLDQPIRLN